MRKKMHNIGRNTDVMKGEFGDQGSRPKEMESLS
jgi:hypothetical protein